jgi:tRNA modification GTPase
VTTIYAVSSGAPPAAIAVLRISGPHARSAATTLVGKLPEARRATLRAVRDPADGSVLDQALVLLFPVSQLVPAVSASTLVLLALLGALAARVGGADMLKGSLRVTFWGALALAVTAGMGTLFGIVA